jgi:hypothetical protein
MSRSHRLFVSFSQLIAMFALRRMMSPSSSIGKGIQSSLEEFVQVMNKRRKLVKKKHRKREGRQVKLQYRG